MQRIKILGLALVAVCALSALASASAFAAPEWLLLTGAISLLLTGAIPAALSIKSKSVGKLLLADLSATGGAVTLLCEGKDKGTVGPGAKDEVTEIAATSCEFDNGQHGECETTKAVTAKAIDLPWTSTLELISGSLRDVVMGTGGEPGWSVECTVLGFFKVTDTCKGLTNTAISTIPTGVLATFDEKTPAASCSLGTSTSGMVRGIDLNENPAGGKITAME